MNFVLTMTDFAFVLKSVLRVQKCKVAAVSGIVVRIAEFNEVLDDLATIAEDNTKQVHKQRPAPPVQLDHQGDL